MICVMSRKDSGSIQVSDEAQAAVKRILGVYGVRIAKKDLVERVLLWLDNQPDAVKGSILGTLPPSHRVNIAKLELERIISDAAGSPNSAGAGESPESLRKVQNLISQGAAANPDAPPKSPEEPPSPIGRHRVKQQSNK